VFGEFPQTKKHNFGSDLLNSSSSWGSEIGWLELGLPWNGSPPNSTPSHSNPGKYWSCQVASSSLIRDSEMKTCLKGLFISGEILSAGEYLTEFIYFGRKRNPLPTQIYSFS
jgi:hypothetical protein